MNYLKLNLASFLFLFSLFTYGSNCSSAANNDWTKVATWSCTNPFTSPGCVDSIVINHVVNVNTQIDLTACGPIYIIVNGTLEFKTGSKLKLADGSFFILNNGASIVPGNGGGNSNLIEIGGNDVWTAADGPKSGPLTYISSGPLPIKLLEFNASNNQGRIDLKWITLNEVNNEYFTIEKSKDAQNWIEVVRTLGAGNSNVNIEYFEVDNEPYQGISYYRLKQTDYDGNFEYFNIVPVKVDEYNGKINIFPNPVMKNENLNISFGNFGQEILLVIRDLKGQEFFSKAKLNVKENNVVAVPISDDIPSGIYIVTATSENQIYNQKIIIN